MQRDRSERHRGARGGIKRTRKMVDTDDNGSGDRLAISEALPSEALAPPGWIRFNSNAAARIACITSLEIFRGVHSERPFKLVAHVLGDREIFISEHATEEEAQTVLTLILETEVEQ